MATDSTGMKKLNGCEEIDFGSFWGFLWSQSDETLKINFSLCFSHPTWGKDGGIS